MVQMLQNFENKFSDLEGSRDSQLFKSDLKTACNDVIRAQRDELHDYHVEYRPLRSNPDNTLEMTRTFLETVQKVDFGWTIDNVPYIKIYAGKDKTKVMGAVRNEFEAGVLYEDNDAQFPSLVLEIVGLDSCVNCVLTIMDRYRLHAGVREKYKEWRQKIVKLYRS
jgi:hypothetical protein